MWAQTIVKALIWWLLAYAALKVARVSLIRAAGYRDAPPSLRDRLRAGEPLLFLAAFATSVPLAFFTGWYSHHKFTLLLNRSIACYGQMAALSDLQPVASDRKSFAEYESIQGQRAIALDAAMHLGRDQRQVGPELDGAKAVYAARYAVLRGHDERLAAHIDTVRRRCSIADGDTSPI